MDYNYLKVKKYDCRVESKDGYTDKYILSFNERQHLKVSEKAKLILDCFNGERNIYEIEKELNDKNILFDISDIKKFVDDVLVQNSILEGMSYDKTSKGKSFMWFHLPIIESNKLSGLFNVLKVLYNKYLGTLVVAMIAICCIFSVYKVMSNETTESVNSLWLILLMYTSLVLHEFGHVSAAYKYGVKVGYLGVGLYLFNPVLYVDMTNVWRLDHKKRVLVDMGGIYFQLITIIPTTIVAIVYQNNFLFLTNIMIIAMTMANLIPFIKLDGYWILCDYLEVDNIASNAFSIVYYNIKGLFKKNDTMNYNNSRSRVYIIFAFIYTISTFLVIGIGAIFVFNTLSNIDTIKTGFVEIYQYIKLRNVGMVFTTLNRIFIFILPILFLIFMLLKIIINVVKSILTGGKRNDQVSRYS